MLLTRRAFFCALAASAVAAQAIPIGWPPNEVSFTVTGLNAQAGDVITVMNSKSNDGKYTVVYSSDIGVVVNTRDGTTAPIKTFKGSKDGD